MPRIRDVAVDARCRRGIPLSEPAKKKPIQPAPGRPNSGRAEILIELVPSISHWRMAVREVSGSPGFDDRLGDAMTRADDQVEPVEVELLDRDGEQGNIPPVVSGGQRKPLDEGRVGRGGFQAWRHAARDLEQREELRVGEQFQKSFQDLLARLAYRSTSRAPVRRGDGRHPQVVGGRRSSLADDLLIDTPNPFDGLWPRKGVGSLESTSAQVCAQR